MKDFKAYIAPFLDKYGNDILKRTDANIAIGIQSGCQKLSSYRRIEKIWRLYIEILLDCCININFCWIRVLEKYQSKNSYRAYPMLCSDFNPNIFHTNKKLSYMFLPITLKTFGSATELTCLTDSLSKWFDIYNKPGWNNIIYGIQDIIYNDKNIIKQKDFVMLISYIETLQNLHGVSKNSDVDRFVRDNLSLVWMRKLKKILEYKTVEDKNLGNCLCQIRNAIVHPKSQNKSHGKYYKIANNEIKLQNIYGIVVGAFVRSFIKDIYNINDESIEKHMNAFISSRSSYKYIKYTK